MHKYRKKPVVIEAIELKESAFTGSHPNPEHIIGVTYVPLRRVALIPTLEGEMTARVGDFIVRGVAGELYPVKPDIFEATYEPVTDKEEGE